MRRRFGIAVRASSTDASPANQRFEYIYNFVDELKKSVYDIDCDIFYRVLYQELSEGNSCWDLVVVYRPISS